MVNEAAANDVIAPLSRSAVSWACFDAGRNCYSMLIVSAVFTPYIATVLAPNAVVGQQIVATNGAWSGIVGAVLAILLGGAVDRLGLRKPALAVLAVLLAAILTSFWWASPGGLLPLSTVIALLLAGTVLFGLIEIVHNAMLINAAGPRELGRASGLGAALGFTVASAVLLLFLWGLVLPAQMTADWLPAKPLFDLDPSRYEPQRIAGPVVAGLLMLTILPLLMFTREIRPARGRPLEAIATSVRELRGLLPLFLARKNVRNFLIARMLYGSGQHGNVMFMSVYAAGAFQWGTAQLMIEALMTSLAATGGGMMSSMIDTRLGTKRGLFFCLIGYTIAFAGMMGTSHDHILFFIDYDPGIHGRPWNGPLYSTWPEWIFAAFDIINTLFLVASLALSRTMMAKLAPPQHASAYFGLYSLSTASTTWLAPLLVGTATAALASQQLGLLPLLGLAVCGTLAMLTVGSGHPPEASLIDQTKMKMSDLQLAQPKIS